ncbi:restriction endonuclease subunit S [Priestia flexa]|uniref:restriction endonuclease subunit S n=1 Tax=Priestia flexa TaxID=86664 RepID=UPI001CFCE830|nr:restriction endonuclease subunit S [Priestia flexa]
MVSNNSHEFLDGVPIDWEVKKLVEIAQFENGKAHEKHIDEDGEYIVVNSKFISSDGKEYKCSNKNLSPLDKGDITMVMSDVPNGKALAKCFLVNENNKFTLNQRICSIKAVGVNNEYLYFYLNRNKYYLAFDNGVGQTNLRKNEVLDCPVLLPPFKEQQKIVAILSSVDEAIEKTEAIIKQTEEAKKGLMQQLLTKGIGHSKFKKTEVGEIPVGWEVKTFKDLLQEDSIIDIQDGNHGNAHPKASDYVSQGIPFIMANNLIKGKIDLVNCKFLNKEQTDKLRIGFAVEGDVLLTHKGTIGRTAIVPRVESYVMLTPQVTYYRVNASRLSNKFLRYFFESNYFQNRLEKLSAQSTRSYIGITNQKSLLMVIPTLEEQKEIVKTLETIDEKIVNEGSTLEQLQILKKGLMQSLLTGKVRVKVDEAEVTQV